SEEMMVRRDLTLLEYTEGRLHLGPISSAKSAELASDARQDGLQVTTEVTAAHLAFSEERLEDFDTNFKLMPPLRTEANRKALIAALKEGKIDVITSDHSPEDEEHKKLEFDLANFGMAGMELFFPMVLSAVGNELPLDELVAKFSIAPREILGIDVPVIAEGEKVNLTVFSTDESSEQSNHQSKAYNIPKLNQQMKGKIYSTFHFH
ncbi:MAG TPA: amidohydrolase family protein, partial [Cryomorphaceae bacterium]|nr:amidohydrolase family protein [Cryomorphaceae bacterium]